MKNLKHILTATLCLFISSIAHAAQPLQRVTVNGIKGVITEIPFTNQTSVAQLKEAIQTQEGLPVDRQLLLRSEKGSFLGFQFNSGVVTALENDKTCSDYDLKAGDEVKLVIRLVKSPAQIEAELKARREKITEVLTQEVLLKELLPNIFAYDICE